jgi:hypothetical protein
MDVLKARLAALGTAVPEILLPGAEVDLQKWAVVACDQFTRDRDFWDRVKETAGSAPSALNFILPEIDLEGGDRGERIRRAMAECLAGNTFAPPFRGCVYVERATPFHPCRRGLVLAIDLEAYDWRPGARSLIRATEGTVPERLPPRVAIRRGAPLETPHILVLIDDRDDALLPALGRLAKSAAPLYRTPLMLGGGGVSGWALGDGEGRAVLADGLEKLARLSRTRYGSPEPFLYAVGDGNHSLAAAKAVWDEYKDAHGGGADGHPARWALVEVENLYDPGIAFEPIHRVLFGASAAEVLDCLSALPGFSRRPVSGRGELARLVGDPEAPRSRLGLAAGTGLFLVESSAPPVITETLQPLLDAFLRDRSGLSIDYIHGGDEVFRLAGTQAAGILLPPVKKSGLFETIARSGPLPRKSFSMGAGIEKRYYLECRALFPWGAGGT